MKCVKSEDNPVSRHGISHLMDVLAKNYDIVAVLAEFERPETSAEHLSLPEQPPRMNVDIPILKRAVDLESRPSYTNHSGNSGTYDEAGRKVNETCWEQWRSSVERLCTEVIEALTEDSTPKFTEKEQRSFSVNALKRDIKRCLIASHGYLETGAALRELQMWKTPLVTLSFFFVYFYSVFRGWLMSMFFFLILLQLSVNYLWTQRGINLGLNFLPRKELPIPKLDISGAQLVFDIARRAQLIFKLIADVLEKLNSLFMWRRPDTTFKFFCVMFVFFVAVSVMPGSTCATITFAALGGKVFVTTYLFNRFPKLRQKFDILVHFFDRLPVLSQQTTVTPSKDLLSPIQNHTPLRSSNSSNALSVNTLSNFKKVC
uniref:GRAM domain-containing protein n=1 Tax=Steinernema glaseri TaxID=37863 RepID=A0A1I7YYG7_9BILA